MITYNIFKYQPCNRIGGATLITILVYMVLFIVELHHE